MGTAGLAMSSSRNQTGREAGLGPLQVAWRNVGTKEYRDRWWALLTDLTLRREGDTVKTLDRLSDDRRHSPLLLLFQAVARETELERRRLRGISAGVTHRGNVRKINEDT